MFNRLKYTSQGIFMGSLITLALCGAAYLHTHDIKFTATASNEAPEIIKAEADAVSMSKLMPPAEKPAKLVKINTGSGVPEPKPSIR